MRHDRKSLWWSLAVMIFVLATLAKHEYNDMHMELYDAYNRPQSMSLDSARQQGTLVAEFDIEPTKLVAEGKTYEFGEAWLEAAYEPRNCIVWLSYDKRARWSYLCVRPRSEWFHETYSFCLTPEYKTEVKIAGRNNDAGFTQLGNDPRGVYFQRVPTNLPGLKIEVSAYNYDKDEDVILGSVQLTRRK